MVEEAEKAKEEKGSLEEKEIEEAARRLYLRVYRAFYELPLIPSVQDAVDVVGGWGSEIIKFKVRGENYEVRFGNNIKAITIKRGKLGDDEDWKEGDCQVKDPYGEVARTSFIRFRSLTDGSQEPGLEENNSTALKCLEELVATLERDINPTLTSVSPVS